MSKWINQFVSELSQVSEPDFFNPWKDHCTYDLNKHAHLKRQTRLRQHLSTQPQYLLIGEAPGYKGARYSGVPFVSEQLLSNGIIPRLVNNKERVTNRIYPFKENSSTAVWSSLFKLNITQTTILWNAFPWHPHAGSPHTNRCPTSEELNLGLPFLEWILRIFPNIKVIAVGQKAREALEKINQLPDCVVRHPSMGGAILFKQQLESFVHQEQGAYRLLVQPDQFALN